jgi:hypothetical protein
MADRRVAVFYSSQATRAELEGRKQRHPAATGCLCRLYARPEILLLRPSSLRCLDVATTDSPCANAPAVADPPVWILQLVCLYASCDMAA